MPRRFPASSAPSPSHGPARLLPAALLAAAVPILLAVLPATGAARPSASAPQGTAANSAAPPAIPALGAQSSRSGGSRGAAADESVQEWIRSILEVAGVPVRIPVAEAPVYGGSALPTFYERRAFRPAWVDPGEPRPVADSLVAAIAAADRDGLRPSEYNLEAIRRLRQWIDRAGGRPGSTTLAELDLLLTDAFLTYADHLADGRLDPVTLHPDWEPRSREVDPVGVLERALEEGRIRPALEDLRPPQDGYRHLQAALARYRERATAGGWPSVPDGPTLTPGDTSGRVVALRARLRGPDGPADVAGEALDSVYGPALSEAVRAFQARHGLEDDGIIGPGTLSALNVPAEDRARQVRVNLERWRWLPRSLGERHVQVNVADFELQVVENDEVMLSMRAIVGRANRKTPVMSDRITYLVFSPFWHVPHNLAVQDQLPLQKQDPDHFRQIGMRVFTGWSADAPEVNPDSVEWSEVSARGFPYRLRQDPGPKNALGQVKFMFPNRFSVYLHDTPGQDLFARRGRSFSSGCIRVARAGELAAYLLRNAPSWTPESIQEAMQAGSERTVQLPEAVPIHLLYLTAFSDGETVQFRPDVYDRDGAVRDGLETAPPIPVAVPPGPAGAR